MKKLTTVAFGAAIVFLLSPLAFAAQETRDLPSFNAIATQGAFTLVVNAGQKQSFEVSGDEAELATLETKVVDGELQISLPRKQSLWWGDRLKITIGMEELQKMSMEGVGDTTLNALSGERFALSYQGVGYLHANGKVQHFALKAEGVGAVNARKLEAQSVDASLQGIGSVSVRATESLNAKVEGLGSLSYYGKPAQVRQSAEGIGSIRAAE
jgi:hypothetical protein